MAKKIVVTGAAGQIAYSLIFRIASGELLGEDQPLELSLLEIPFAENFLKAIVMELEDCGFPLVKKIIATTDPAVAFEKADLLFLVGSKPRGAGMERKDLLLDNGKIFIEQGKALRGASSHAKVLVVGNPCNTNALILKKSAKQFNPKQIFAMTKLDELRAKGYIARKLGVGVEAIEPLYIWGNHSKTQVVDYLNAQANGKPLESFFKENSFLEKELQSFVQERGAKVIEARGKSSAASAANAALLSMRDLIGLTGKSFSAATFSEGNPYGIDPDLMFSFPCRCAPSGDVKIIEKLEWNLFLKEKIKASEKELQEEKEIVKSLW